MKKKIKKGDKVKVVAGKDRGREAVVERILGGRVVLPGINVYKRHLKPQGDKRPGGIKERVRPLPVNTVQLLCPSCHQPTRVGWRAKNRFCKKCGQKID